MSKSFLIRIILISGIGNKNHNSEWLRHWIPIHKKGSKFKVFFFFWLQDFSFKVSMVLVLASFCLIHNMSRFLWHGWDFGYPVTLIPWFSIANSALKANNLKFNIYWNLKSLHSTQNGCGCMLVPYPRLFST